MLGHPRSEPAAATVVATEGDRTDSWGGGPYLHNHVHVVPLIVRNVLEVVIVFVIDFVSGSSHAPVRAGACTPAPRGRGDARDLQLSSFGGEGADRAVQPK